MMKRYFNLKYIVLLSMGLSLGSCTKLNESIQDEVLGEAGSNPLAAIASAYDRLGKGTFTDHGGVFGLQQYTTDEAVLPTRGSDWGDGGKWRAMHEFTWQSDNPIVNDNWSNLTNGITRSMVAISSITASDMPDKKMYLAEAKALLAFYMFNMYDLFSQTPYRDPLNEKAPLEVKKGKEGIDALILEMESLIPDLPAFGASGTNNGRFTKEAAYGVLANMYLNRAVIKNPYAASFDFLEKAVGSSTDTDMDKVIYYTSLLIESPKFSLASNYFDNFSIDSKKSKELIWVVLQKIDMVRNGSNSFGYIGFERNQRPTPDTRGTNAACMTPEFYYSWDGNHDDPRFSRKYQYPDGTWFYNDRVQEIPSTSIYPGSTKMWFHFNRGIMVGQQYGPRLDASGKGFILAPSGKIQVFELDVEKSAGTKMNFTPELNFDKPTEAVFAQNQINRGARVFKYENDPGNGNGNSNVDIPLVRLGVMYTMRAEAYMRKGAAFETQARADINKIRTSRTNEANLPGAAISTLTMDQLYKEIAYESYWELIRRQQMIRFGKYDLPLAKSAKPASQPFRRIFPVPQRVLDVTKILSQNEGYK